MKLETSAKQKVSMKIETEGYSRPMSKTSSFLRFLVKICFITIKESDERLKFSFIRSILYFIGSFGWFAGGIIVTYAYFRRTDIQSNFKVQIKNQKVEL